jgi:hypothetical protein
MNREETIKKWTERNIAEVKTENPEGWYINFFNNLDTHLPWGFMARHTRLYDRPCKKGGMNQTLGDFFRDCESAVYEAGLTPEQVIEARRESAINQTDTLWELITPVYIILREKGYSHRDLWT